MRLYTAIILLSVALSASSSPVTAGDNRAGLAHTTLSEMSVEDQNAALELSLTEVRRVLSRQGADAEFVGIHFDPVENFIVVDLATNYLPSKRDYLPKSLEEDLHAISTAILGLVENVLGMQIYGVTYTFDGLPLPHYFPNDFPPEESLEEELGSRHLLVRETAGIVLSAGHGYFRNFRTTPFQWTFQRDEHFGIQEDLVTLDLAASLANAFSARNVHFPLAVRSGSHGLHEPSGHPWREISARYYLQELLPEQKDIWNSLPGETDSWRREMDEDIRARPNYANFVGASGIISVHTNGDDSGLARGIRIYYQPGRSADRQLANHMLCYMEEIVRAQEDYEDFPVSPAAHAENHGENRLAQGIPAVIVENGFHSNPLDAAALADPVFREASMKGVEKGARLYEEGKPCRHFELEELDDIDQPWGVVGTLEIPFDGFPEFPVTVTVAQQSCGPVCSHHEITIEEKVDSPFTFPWLCDGAPPGYPPLPPLEFQVTAEDVDGVKTDPQSFVFTCGV